MNPTEPIATESRILCAKCGEENLRGDKYCQTCGSLLYVRCRRCGARNERAARRCASCRRRLHKRWWRRRVDSRFGQVSPLHAVLLTVGILLLLGFLIHLASKGTFGMKFLPVRIELTPQ